MQFTPSQLGRARLLAGERRPLFLADWERVVFLHFALPAETLARFVPFALERWEDEAFLSLVAFTMRRLRLAAAPRASEKLLRPISEHRFLNARTYVRHGGEGGIYFLAEWLDNRAAAPLGPPLFGLPYRRGELHFWHEGESGGVSGQVRTREGELRYAASLRGETTAEARADFLLERYAAFTHWRGLRRLFRIWHEPWPRRALALDELRVPPWPWLEGARFVAADYSPGVRGVWMGRPHFAPRKIYEHDHPALAIAHAR